jgi:hypothetical protein
MFNNVVVQAVVCTVCRARHTVHTTAWNTFYQHCWTFNDVFLLSIYTKL